MFGLIAGVLGQALGCTAVGITAGSPLAAMMSWAATSGVGMGVVSTLQSAGTIAATTAAGSAAATVSAPLAVVAGLGLLLL